MRRISKWHGRYPRARWHDQRRGGWYFITINTYNRLPLFATACDQGLGLTESGRVVADEWQRTARIRYEVSLGPWVVMPDHFHALIAIREDIAQSLQPVNVGTPTLGRVRHGISSVVGCFKSACTRRIRMCGSHSGPVWQSGFHDEIVRNHEQWKRICFYIQDNPRKLLLKLQMGARAAARAPI